MIKDLQTKLLSMGHSGCLALCYLYMIDIDPEELVFKYDELVDNKIMTEDRLNWQCDSCEGIISIQEHICSECGLKYNDE